MPRPTLVMRAIRSFPFLLTATLLLAPVHAGAAGRADAPSLAVDPAADVTDVYAFVSYGVQGSGPPERVTLIMSTRPFFEPAAGPVSVPFDPDVVYELKIDDTDDAVADVTFQFRFTTELPAPALPQTLFGAGGTGILAPSNSPPPVPAGALVVPPKVERLGDPGVGLRQRYTVTMVKGRTKTALDDGLALYAVPPNVGPRTADYVALFAGNIYDLAQGVRAFAGVTDDAFFADAGAVLDTFNLRSAVAPGVLTPVQDAALQNFASDTLAGYAVSSLALEVPIELLTSTGAREPADSPAATIGVWATTSRAKSEKHPPPKKRPKKPSLAQMDRMGNPLLPAFFLPLGVRDAFVIAQPKLDAQLSVFLLDPLEARFLNAATAGLIAIPSPPRDDLRQLLQYLPPVAAPGTPPGPVADLLRLNVGVPATAPGLASRLGILGGDAAGFPNGRRLSDDVTDVMLRLVAGPGNVNSRLGDGVNVNDAPFLSSFPYLAFCPSGRDRRHLDPGEPGCTAGAGAPCPL